MVDFSCRRSMVIRNRYSRPMHGWSRYSTVRFCLLPATEIILVRFFLVLKGIFSSSAVMPEDADVCHCFAVLFEHVAAKRVVRQSTDYDWISGGLGNTKDSYAGLSISISLLSG